MANIHTLYNTGSSTQTLVMKADGDDRPSRIQVFSEKENCCSPIVALVLLVLGVIFTIMGSLSILSWKYSALSALSMTPEFGLGLVITGTAMSTITGSLLFPNLCQKKDRSHLGHPLGRKNKSICPCF